MHGGVERRDAADALRSVFRECPISLWEEDVSALVARLGHLRPAAAGDLRGLLERDAAELRRCAGLVRVEAVNRATLELFEAPDEATLLAGLAGVFPDESLPTFREFAVALAEGRTTCAAAGVARTLGGRTIDVEMTWTVVPDGSGTPARVLLTVVDRTEERRAAAACRQTESRLREAQRIARLGSWEWSIPTGRFTWSDELCRLFGVDPPAATPSLDAVVARLAPECRERFVADIRGAAAAGRPFDGEYRITADDGAVRHLRAVGEPSRDGDGRPTAMSGVMQDVTERKNEEERLRESQRTLQTVIETAPS